MIMKDKIVQLMKSEGLTSSRLAEILEIQPSGVSHLVSGRNKPSFELLQKILRRFPEINPYWLMLDETKMYLDTKPTTSPHIATTTSSSSPSASDDKSGLSLNVVDLFSAIEQPRNADSPTGNAFNKGCSSTIIEQNGAKMSRVILFFDDGSCQTFGVK